MGDVLIVCQACVLPALVLFILACLCVCSERMLVSETLKVDGTQLERRSGGRGYGRMVEVYYR